MSAAAIILAAGKGTRMKSARPKVCHEICGVAMVEHVRRAVIAAGATRVIVVVSPETEADIRQILPEEGVEFAIQDPPQGTGHAALQALPHLQDEEDVLVVCGDTPLLRAETLKAMLDERRAYDAAAVVATFAPEDLGQYGRVHRDGDQVRAIIEHNDLTDTQKEELNEANSAVYAFRTAELREYLPNIAPNATKGEIYLTDMFAALFAKTVLCLAAGPYSEDEFMGVNDRWALAEATRIMRLDILHRLADNGVTIVDPASTYVEADVTAEADVIIHPMTVIEGRTHLGPGAQVGPNTWIKDATIGARARVFMSHVDQAIMAEDTRCGPFANLRPGAAIEPRVKIGNFVEIKNAVVGEGTAVSHLTYLGDASVGPNANIGAGTITCNYDGFAKHRTTIGAGAFVGSNSTLVAPITIGKDAFVAAGSVVTKDVPDNALAIGRGRQDNKEGWAERWKKQREAGKDPSENSTT